jgi:hypothetical protein
MLTQHIAIAPEAGDIDLAQLTRVSAAIQKQVTRDLAPLWGVTATVDAFQSLEDVPIGYWPIVVSRDPLGRQAGVHLDRNGQPYAHIGYSSFWSLDASRACLEMLINPFGDRTTAGTSPRADQGPVEFLVEVCGPCAARIHGYAIHGVFVSDFCTPAYFGVTTNTVARGPLSFNGSLRRPWQLLQGGFLTWHESASNSWWMRTQPGQVPQDSQLGVVTHSMMSARALAQRSGPDRGYGGGEAVRAFDANMMRLRNQATEASMHRAIRLRSLLSQRRQEAIIEPSYSAYEQAGLELPEDADHWDVPHTTVVEDQHVSIPGAYTSRVYAESMLVELREEEQATTIKPPTLLHGGAQRRSAASGDDETTFIADSKVVEVYPEKARVRTAQVPLERVERPASVILNPGPVVPHTPTMIGVPALIIPPPPEPTPPVVPATSEPQFVMDGKVLDELRATSRQETRGHGRTSDTFVVGPATTLPPPHMTRNSTGPALLIVAGVAVAVTLLVQRGMSGFGAAAAPASAQQAGVAENKTESTESAAATPAPEATPIHAVQPVQASKPKAKAPGVARTVSTPAAATPAAATPAKPLAEAQRKRTPVPADQAATESKGKSSERADSSQGMESLVESRQ